MPIWRLPWIFFGKKVIFERFSFTTSSKNWKNHKGPPCEKYRNFFDNFFLNRWYHFYIHSYCPWKNYYLQYVEKIEKFFLKQIFDKGGPLWIFSIFSWSPKRKTFKNDFFAKKISRQCSDMPKLWFQFGKTEIGTKNFQ